MKWLLRLMKLLELTFLNMESLTSNVTSQRSLLTSLQFSPPKFKYNNSSLAHVFIVINLKPTCSSVAKFLIIMKNMISTPLSMEILENLRSRRALNCSSGSILSLMIPWFGESASDVCFFRLSFPAFLD